MPSRAELARAHRAGLPKALDNRDAQADPQNQQGTEVERTAGFVPGVGPV